MELGVSTAASSRASFEASRAAAMASIDAALRKSSSAFAVAQARLRVSGASSPASRMDGERMPLHAAAAASGFGSGDAGTSLQQVLRERFAAGGGEGAASASLGDTAVTSQIERQLECVCVVTNLQQAAAVNPRGRQLPEYLHKPVAVALGFEADPEETERKSLQPLKSSSTKAFWEDVDLAARSRRLNGGGISASQTDGLLDLARSAAAQTRASQGAAAAFLRRAKEQPLVFSEPEVLDGFRPQLPKTLAAAARRKVGAARVDVAAAAAPEELLRWKFRNKPSAASDDGIDAAGGGCPRMEIADLVSHLAHQPLEVHRLPDRRSAQVEAPTPARNVLVGSGLPKPPPLDEGEGAAVAPQIRAIRAGRKDALVSELRFDDFPSSAQSQSIFATSRKKKAAAEKGVQTEAPPKKVESLPPSVGNANARCVEVKRGVGGALCIPPEGEEPSSDASSEEDSFSSSSESAAKRTRSSSSATSTVSASSVCDPDSPEFALQVASFWRDEMEEHTRRYYSAVYDAMLGLPQRVVPELGEAGALPSSQENPNKPGALAGEQQETLRNAFLFYLRNPAFLQQSACALGTKGESGVLPSTDLPSLASPSPSAFSAGLPAEAIASVFAPEFGRFLQQHPFAIPAVEFQAQNEAAQESWAAWQRSVGEVWMAHLQGGTFAAFQGEAEGDDDSAGEESAGDSSAADAEGVSEDSESRWRRHIRGLRGALREAASRDSAGPATRGGLRFFRRRRSGREISSSLPRRDSFARLLSPESSASSEGEDRRLKAQIQALGAGDARRGFFSGGGRCRGGRFFASSLRDVRKRGGGVSAFASKFERDSSAESSQSSSSSAFGQGTSEAEAATKRLDREMRRSLLKMQTSSLQPETRRALPRVRACVNEMSARLQDRQRALRLAASSHPPTTTHLLQEQKLLATSQRETSCASASREGGEASPKIAQMHKTGSSPTTTVVARMSASSFPWQSSSASVAAGAGISIAEKLISSSVNLGKQSLAEVSAQSLEDASTEASSLHSTQEKIGVEIPSVAREERCEASWQQRKKAIDETGKEESAESEAEAPPSPRWASPSCSVLSSSLRERKVLANGRRKAALDAECSTNVALSSAREMLKVTRKDLLLSPAEQQRQRASPEEEVVPALRSGGKFQKLLASLRETNQGSACNSPFAEALHAEPPPEPPRFASGVSSPSEKAPSFSTLSSSAFSEATPLRPPPPDSAAWWESSGHFQEDKRESVSRRT